MKKGTCKHYTGDYRNTYCGAGVCYRDVTSEPDNNFGVSFRKPCVNWDVHPLGKSLSPSQLEQWKKRGHCDKYEEPTQDEIDKFKNDMEEHISKLTKGIEIARTAIIVDLNSRRERGENGAILNLACDPEVEDGPSNFVSGAGEIDCPVCHKGKLRYSRAAYNGHVHAKCSTKDCVAWME